MLRWFNTQKELLEFMWKNGEDRGFIQRMLARQEIMKENGRYCFTSDYDRYYFEERIKELEDKLENVEKEMNKYKKMVDGCLDILLPFD